MKTFILTHQHAPAECTSAYEAWNGFASPLRGQTVPSTCARHRPSSRAAQPSEHEIWWVARAADRAGALAQLPPYVEDRAQVREVSEVTIR
jgi:hypothetical protein